MRSIAPWRYTSFHRLWAQRPWRLPPLRDFCNDVPGLIRGHRHGTLVFVWRGTRRWDHRKSSICTTVCTGARRTSEPETSLSLSWRKFVASSVFFSPVQVRGDPYTNLVRVKKRKSSREMENERIRILLERQQKQILAEVRTEIQKHEFQADSDRRSIQELWTKHCHTSHFLVIARRLTMSHVTLAQGVLHSQDSGTTEWSQLYEWVERLSGCWVSTQRTIPRSQSTSVISTLSWSWGMLSRPGREC